MANSNAPMGLVPRRYRNGSPYMGACRTYFVPATDASAIYPGDPVIIAGDGDTTGVTPTCTLATAATGRITGVMVGIRPGGNNTLIPPKYRAASTAEYILVADEPDLLFEAQEDGVGGSLAATNIGQNISLISGSGNTYTGMSGWMIDSSTAATTNTLQMRIISLVSRLDNVLGTTAKWLVANNLPTETGAAGSTGV
jgi:hypothetical protein